MTPVHAEHGPEGRGVVACVRPVDLRPTVDPLDGTVTRDDRSPALAPQEAAAVEHALRIAEGWGVSVRVIVGGPQPDPAFVDELAALGAGVEVVSGPDGDPEELVPDERLAAARVARVIEAGGGADLVLCGDRSADRGTGAFGAFLAHELGVAQALGLVSLGIDGDHLTGERRLEGGWRERVVVRGPAVCSVEGGLRLRRAPLGALLAASAATHRRVPDDGDAARGAEAGRAAPGPGPGTGSAALAVHATERSRENVAVGPPRPHRARVHVVPPPVGGAHERLLALTGALTAHDPPALVGPVGAGEAAAAILEYLAHHGHAPEGDGRAPEHHGHDPVAEAAP